MLIVGPRMQWAPLARASSPMAAPAARRSGRLKVAPRAVPHGKQAAGMPLKKRVPRTPLGPSVTRMEGMEWAGRGWVCHMSMPGGGGGG